MPIDSSLITKTQVKQRGWSDAMITRLLGDPDQMKPNRMYRNSGPIQLFLVSRVEEAESAYEFAELMAKKQKRSRSAQKAVETKTEATLDIIRHARINVDRVGKVRRSAINTYNSWNAQKSYDVELATEKSDEAFLRRITVNYIRHNLTVYDTALDVIAGRVGTYEGYWLLKERVLAAIARAYPEYHEECERQLGQEIACCPPAVDLV